MQDNSKFLLNVELIESMKQPVPQSFIKKPEKIMKYCT